MCTLSITFILCRLKTVLTIRHFRTKLKDYRTQVDNVPHRKRMFSLLLNSFVIDCGRKVGVFLKSDTRFQRTLTTRHISEDSL